MSDEHKQYASTAVATLEAHILSVHSAKGEAEWWAHKEILRLRAENEKLREAKHSAGERITGYINMIEQREAEIEKLRAALKPFANEVRLYHIDEELMIEWCDAAAAALKEINNE